MDETKHLLRIIEADLEGIKENLVRGIYSDQSEYLRVLGESKTLLKMINEAKALIAKREQDDADDADD
jgi:hypothetical protein